METQADSRSASSSTPSRHHAHFSPKRPGDCDAACAWASSSQHRPAARMKESSVKVTSGYRGNRLFSSPFLAPYLNGNRIRPKAGMPAACRDPTSSRHGISKTHMMPTVHRHFSNRSSPPQNRCQPFGVQPKGLNP